MYIRACRQILVHYSKRFFKENFLDTILPIESDPVLSVRQLSENQLEFFVVIGSNSTHSIANRNQINSSLSSRSHVYLEN